MSISDLFKRYANYLNSHSDANARTVLIAASVTGMGAAHPALAAAEKIFGDDLSIIASASAAASLAGAAAGVSLWLLNRRLMHFRT